jgi:hypothetical protein
MSDVPARRTEETVVPETDPEAPATSPVDTVHDEKRNSTSSRPPLHHYASSPVPVVAPVFGAVGIFGEPLEKALSAASAFKHHQSPPPAHHEHEHEHGLGHDQDGEKTTQAVEEPGSSSENAPGKPDGVTTSEESEVESEVEVIYPGRFQLGLLTIGLCLSTFAIALGRLWMSHLESPFVSILHPQYLGLRSFTSTEPGSAWRSSHDFVLCRRPNADTSITSVTEFKLTSDRQYHHRYGNPKDHHLL